MTIVVLWYREAMDQLWCAADSRLSAGTATLTDTGSKVFPVPVVCRRHVKGRKYEVTWRRDFGFAFAGSTLSATGTHALATACTQNLVSTGAGGAPMSLEALAELFKSVGEHWIRDAASRLTANFGRYGFAAMIFGWCPVTRRFGAYELAPNVVGDTFSLRLAEMNTAAGFFHPLGSGTTEFLALHHELSLTHPDPGVINTLAELVRRDARHDVGGHIQLGIAERDGFHVAPLIDEGTGPGGRSVNFLGFDVGSATLPSGFRIGYRSVRVNF